VTVTGGEHLKAARRKSQGQEVARVPVGIDDEDARRTVQGPAALVLEAESAMCRVEERRY
jgi:hypothetical protein